MATVSLFVILLRVPLGLLAQCPGPLMFWHRAHLRLAGNNLWLTGNQEPPSLLELTLIALSLPRAINSNFSCSLTRYVTLHSTKNSAFHSFTEIKDDYTIQFSLPYSYISLLTLSIPSYILPTFSREMYRWGSENWYKNHLSIWVSYEKPSSSYCVM